MTHFEEVVFVFSGREVNWDRRGPRERFPDGEVVQALESWRPLIEGRLRLAREMHFWEENVKRG